MKRDRIPALLAYIKALQPNFRVPEADKELEVMVRAWGDMLEDLAENVVKSAVKMHVSSSPFPVSASRMFRCLSSSQAKESNTQGTPRCYT